MSGLKGDIFVLGRKAYGLGGGLFRVSVGSSVAEPKDVLGRVSKVKMSRDRSTIAAIVREESGYGGPESIYLLRANTDWQPTRIVEDCSQWGALNIHLSADGKTIVLSGLASDCSVLHEDDNWRRRVPQDAPETRHGVRMWQVQDQGQIVSMHSGRYIFFWDVRGEWTYRSVEILPSSYGEYTEVSPEYYVGAGGAIVLATYYMGRSLLEKLISFAARPVAPGWIDKLTGADALFLVQRFRGSYERRLVMRGSDEIEVHCIGENNNAAFISKTSRDRGGFTLYGLWQERDWEPQIVLSGDGYPLKVLYCSADGDMVVVAVGPAPDPDEVLYMRDSTKYEIYVLTWQDSSWQKKRLFSLISKDPSVLADYVCVSADYELIAGLDGPIGDYRSDNRHRLMVMRPDGTQALSPCPAAPRPIAFSPDGNGITYMAYLPRSGDRRPHLMRHMRQVYSEPSTTDSDVLDPLFYPHPQPIADDRDTVVPLFDSDPPPVFETELVGWGR